MHLIESQIDHFLSKCTTESRQCHPIPLRKHIAFTGLKRNWTLYLVIMRKDLVVTR